MTDGTRDGPAGTTDGEDRRRFEDLTCVEFAAWLDEDDRDELVPRGGDPALDEGE